jgi:hypothetical protein
MPMEAWWLKLEGGSRQLAVVVLLLALLQQSEMQASGIASSPFTFNKPKVAPGLQDLGDSVASYLLVAGYIVPH